MFRRRSAINGWVPAADEPVAVAAALDPSAPRRVLRPQPGGVVAPLRRLGTRRGEHQPGRWWAVGTHGGAGVTSLLAVVPGGADGHGRWPVTSGSGGADRRDVVVLVARTHHHGLTTALAAVQEWAAGAAPASVELAGVVFIADAPGRLPGPTRAAVRSLAGAVPETWQLPWCPQWRVGPPVDPPPVAAVIGRDLTAACAAVNSSVAISASVEPAREEAR